VINKLTINIQEEEMKEEFFSLSSLDGQKNNRIQSPLDMKDKATEKDFNNTSSNSDSKRTETIRVVGAAGATEPLPPPPGDSVEPGGATQPPSPLRAPGRGGRTQPPPPPPPRAVGKGGGTKPPPPPRRG
jgi:hypothetical protein